MKLVTLDSILTFHRGITFKPDDKVEVGSDDSVVCLRTKNIQKELDESDLLAVPSSFIKRDELYVKQGDILISTANSWNLVGKSVRVIKTEHKSTIGGFISLLRPKADQIDPDYLFRFITMDETQSRIRNLGKQTTNISNLDRVRFLKLQIPLPPLETQKKIAVVLEKADQLRKDCQKMEQELNSLAQSVFIQTHIKAVKEPFTFGELALKEKNSFVNGPFGSNLLSSELTSEGVPVLYIRDIASGVFKRKKNVYVTSSKALELNTCRVDAGDVLVAKVGDPPGTAAIYPKGEPAAIVTQDVIRIKCNDLIVIAEYLIAYFNSSLGIHSLKAITVEATRSRIGLGSLKKLNIELPNIDDQMKFVKLSRQTTELLSENKNLKQQYEDEFNSLMQKAFKGELNL
jgi:type I restriction enzyme S subunit